MVKTVPGADPAGAAWAGAACATPPITAATISDVIILGSADRRGIGCPGPRWCGPVGADMRLGIVVRVSSSARVG
ncbi:hypothetical protein GCM10022238_08540 [Gordonia hankookensis]